MLNAFESDAPVWRHVMRANLWCAAFVLFARALRKTRLRRLNDVGQTNLPPPLRPLHACPSTIFFKWVRPLRMLHSSFLRSSISSVTDTSLSIAAKSKGLY